MQSKLSMQKKMLGYYKNVLGSKKNAAKSLYALCIESIQKSISIIDLSLAKKDYSELYAALHNLKGTLGSTGLNELMDNAAVLCKAAKSLSNGEIHFHTSEFEREIYKFKESLLVLCGSNR